MESKMTNKFTAFMAIAVLVTTISVPINAYALDYTNFFAGAEGQENNSGQKGLRTVIEIESGSGDQNFDWSSTEKHNFFIEMKDSSNYIHHVGYFVDDDAPTTAKFFSEVFLGSTKVHSFEASSAVSSDGTNQLFAMHRSSSTWSYYDGTGFGDVQSQYWWKLI